MSTEKQNKLNIVVNNTLGYIKVINVTTIPFQSEDCNARNKYTATEVITLFGDIICDALEERMKTCINMLNDYIDNIVFNNGTRIIFKKENDVVHSFNVPSYNVMNEAISYICRNEADKLNLAHYDQIIKALYWVKKPCDRNGISFDNLISCLMESILFSISKK